VFIIPEQRDLHVLDGEFRLKPISKPRGSPDVITVFLRSLTEYWDGKLIAVILAIIKMHTGTSRSTTGMPWPDIVPWEVSTASGAGPTPSRAPGGVSKQGRSWQSRRAPEKSADDHFVEGMSHRR